MATITGMTAARMKAIEAASIVKGAIVGDNLILERFDKTTINAGDVRGPSGLTPALRGTSTTSQTIGTGSKTFATSMNVAFPVGSVVRAVGVSAANYMVGNVTAATTTSVTINVTEISGSGTYASWTLTIGSFRGTDGTVTGAAGGALSGSYPNPALADGSVTDVKVAAANKDGAVGTPSMRTIGSGAQQAAAGDHSHAIANTSRAYLYANTTTAQTATSAGSMVTKTGWTVEPNSANVTANADGTFTVDVTGDYNISGNLTVAATATANVRYWVVVLVDGVALFENSGVVGNRTSGMPFSFNRRLSAGSVITLQFNATGASLTTVGFGANNCITIAKIAD